MARAWFVCCLVATLLFDFLSPVFSQAAEDWNRWAREELERTLKLETLNTNTAKNVIVLLGDGMGLPTITSGRIYKGQLDGKSGEETSLNFESLPRTALIKTYPADYQVPDSSATATAIFSGVKANYGTVGVDTSAVRGNCSSGKTAEVYSVFDHAILQGKAAGIVTTARMSHASPSAVYAHSAERDWEAVAEDDCVDIAAQLIERAADFQVLLGGGRRSFLPNTMPDPETNEMGRREDGRDLISEWQNNVPDGTNGHYVWNKTEFDAIDPANTDYLFGLFEYTHMQYEANRADDTAGEPSIAEMTEKAIQILSKNVNGFFLFIEGGRIDHGHHFNWAYGALNDLVAFDEAVGKAINMTETVAEETLLIVTADHSHVNTISGYPKRGNPILGKTGDIGEDGLPFTTLSYANGPTGHAVRDSFNHTGNRPNLTDVDTEAADYVQDSLVPLEMETHGGEDVSVHADGPYSHLFQNVHEQNYIAHVIKYAACLGEYEERCTQVPTTLPTSVSAATGKVASPLGFLMMTLVCVVFNKLQ